MVRTNISNLKNRLSHYLRLVRAGEVVEITDRKVPLARIEAIDAFDDTDAGNGWLQWMVEVGTIVAPRSKTTRFDFTLRPPGISKRRAYAGVLDALKEEREKGRPVAGQPCRRKISSPLPVLV
jgi:prevent-host-death family protein